MTWSELVIGVTHSVSTPVRLFRFFLKLRRQLPGEHSAPDSSLQNIFHDSPALGNFGEISRFSQVVRNISEDILQQTPLLLNPFESVLSALIRQRRPVDFLLTEKVVAAVRLRDERLDRALFMGACNLNLTDLALKKFQTLPKTIFFVNRLLGLCASEKLVDEAQRALNLVATEGLTPDKTTVLNVCRLVAGTVDLTLCRRLPALIAAAGCSSDLDVLSSSLFAYSKCRMAREARHTFALIPVKNRSASIWNNVLMAHVSDGNNATDVITLADIMLSSSVTVTAPIAQALTRSATLTRNPQLACIAERVAKMANAGNDKRMVAAQIDMYGKCRYPKDAKRLFDGMLDATGRDVVVWTALLLAHSFDPESARSVPRLLDEMLASGVKPNEVTVQVVLRAAAIAGDLELGKRGWKLAEDICISTSPQILTLMIELFGKCHDHQQARLAFDQIPKSARSNRTWTALMSVYTHTSESASQISSLLTEMIDSDVSPDMVTLLVVLRAAASTKNPTLGDQGLQLAQKVGCTEKLPFQTALIDMYGKTGRPADAVAVFNQVPSADRNCMVWTALLLAHSFDPESARSVPRLLDEMLASGVKSNEVTVQVVLRAAAIAGDLELGQRGWKLATDLKCDRHPNVLSATLDMYGKCSEPHTSLDLFKSIPISLRTTSIWNSFLLSQSFDEYHARTTSDHLIQMRNSGVRMDFVTAHILIRAAAMSKIRELADQGLQLAQEVGCAEKLPFQTALIDMYGKTGRPADAVAVFNQVPSADRNCMVWTALLLAHSFDPESARSVPRLLDEMLASGVKSNEVTVQVVLRAAAIAGDLELGQRGWKLATDLKCDRHPNVLSAAIDMYGKCDRASESRAVFDGIPFSERSIVQYNCFFFSHSRSMQDARLVAPVYKEMFDRGMIPNEYTFVSLINVAAASLDLAFGSRVLDDASRSPFANDERIVAANIKMLGKCNKLDAANSAFLSVKAPSALTYAAIIAICGLNGHGSRAVEYATRAVEAQISITKELAIAVMHALSHCCLIDDAMHFFRLFPDSVKSDLDVTITAIDCLARAGKLDEAENLLELCPDNLIALTAVLGACRTYDKVGRAEILFEQLVASHPTSTPAYVIMANIYGALKLFAKQDEIMARAHKLGLKKTPGISTLILESGRTEDFYAHHSGHTRQADIDVMLARIHDVIRKGGYEPNRAFVTKPLGSVEKEEQSLCHHSERFAIAYGMIETPGKELTIVKNLRVCGDCHSATKLISREFNVVVNVRDAARWHHFRVDGTCSCGDKY